MSLRTILMTLILGTSTIAAAQPYRPDVRDHHDGRINVDSDRWVPLATARARDGQQVVRLGKRAGKFDKIRLQVDTGSVYVRRLTVMFANKTSTIVTVDRKLRTGEMLDLDVPGERRSIIRIVVTTERARNWRNTGTFSLLGARPDFRPQFGWQEHWDKHYNDRSYDRR